MVNMEEVNLIEDRYSMDSLEVVLRLQDWRGDSLRYRYCVSVMVLIEEYPFSQEPFCKYYMTKSRAEMAYRELRGIMNSIHSMWKEVSVHA